MKSADNLAEYLYYQVFQKYETKYILLKYGFNYTDESLKKYLDNMNIIGQALLLMSEVGEFH